ncbi:MAG: hypothetical protein AB1645_08580 [Bacillota bacterium]
MCGGSRPLRRRLPAAGLGAFFSGPDRRRSAALLTLGFLGGLVAGIAGMAGRLDDMAIQRDELLVKAADLEIRVERLQERLDRVLAGGSGPVVQEVTLNLQGLDEVTRLRVRFEAAALVDDLIGKKVSDLDPALAFHLLHGRTLRIEGRTVALRVLAVVLGPETAYWVELEVLPGDGPPPG